MKTILKIIFFLIFILLIISASFKRPLVKETFRSTFDSSVINEIKIINKSGDVRITNWDSNYIEYTVIKRAFFKTDLEKVVINVKEGNTFIIETKYPPYWCDVSIDYEIKIPKTLTVFINNTDGDIYIDGGKNIRDITLLSGDIEIKNCLFIERIKSISGDIKVDINGLTNDAYIESMDGDIIVNVKKDIYKEIITSVKDGDVKIYKEISGNGQFNINLKSFSGDIIIN